MLLLFLLIFMSRIVPYSTTTTHIIVTDCVREHCPAYFNNVCIPVAGISGRANPRSAERHDMLVPSTRTQLGRRTFHVQSQPSGTRLHHISAHHPLVVDSLELGWKPVSSHRPTRTPLRTFAEERIILHLNQSETNTLLLSYFYSLTPPAFPVSMLRVSALNRNKKMIYT